MSVPVRGGAAVMPGYAGDGMERAPSSYHESAPSAGVAAVAVCTWEGHGGWDRSLRVLPDGCVDLVWDGSRLAAAGARVGPVRHMVQGGSRNVGLRLRPGMAGPVLGWPVQEIPGECVAIEALWGSAARRWEDRLGSAADAAGQRAELECLVAERVAAGDGPDRLVIEACRRLSSSATSVEDIATALAVSGRELRRRFRHSVGYGPKALQRVLRFQRFVSRLGALAAGETTLAALAVGVGYADQAHLCRECQTLSGSSPRSLLACWTA